MSTPVVTQGSSPLARGLRRGGRWWAPGRRIIPARAGFTIREGNVRVILPDHPRSRGVYPTISPHGRDALWIIPARAGFTMPDPRGPGGVQDHPRSRGVYRRRPSRNSREAGSSPLARGLREAGEDQYGEPRIIPARAGFTDYPAGEGFGDMDHPRSRGVYSPAAARSGCGAGSSPLARGLRDAPFWEVRVDRIIPARAGFTIAFILHRSRREDHPRSRGVYTGPYTSIDAR